MGDLQVISIIPFTCSRYGRFIIDLCLYWFIEPIPVPLPMILGYSSTFTSPLFGNIAFDITIAGHLLFGRFPAGWVTLDQFRLF